MGTTSKIVAEGKVCTSGSVCLCVGRSYSKRVAEVKAYECKDEEGARAFVVEGATQELT